MNAPRKVEAESLAQAMALAFAEIEGATKAANNPHFKSKYADLTSVIEAIKPALVKHGLFFTQNPRPHENGVEIETVLHHANGDVLSLGSLFVPADRNNAQGFGSALTYARRYALVTAFGVPVEDDDGNAAAKAPPRQQAAPAPNSIDAEWSARPKDGGPTKTALDGLVRTIAHNLEGCGDEDELTAYTQTDEYKEGKATLEEYRPSALYGPAPSIMPEFIPLREIVKRKMAMFRINAPEPSILQAG